MHHIRLKKGVDKCGVSTMGTNIHNETVRQLPKSSELKFFHSLEAWYNLENLCGHNQVIIRLNY
jgi:hypothetical protein